MNQIQITPELDAAISDTPFKFAVRIVNEITRQLQEQQQAAAVARAKAIPQEAQPVEEAQAATTQA